MLIFDIDQTLIPTRTEDFSHLPGKKAVAFGFPVFMAQHLIDFLRSRDDVALLSTWGDESSQLAKAFDFRATALAMRDFSDEGGIHGKLATVTALKPALWADDQISPFMETWCSAQGIRTLVPEGAYISEDQLKLI